MIHVGTAGTVWVCPACASAPMPELRPVEDDRGSVLRVPALAKGAPTTLDYLAPCPWCGSDAHAVRHAVIVRLCVADESEAKLRGLDTRKARTLEAGDLVAYVERKP